MSNRARLTNYRLIVLLGIFAWLMSNPPSANAEPMALEEYLEWIDETRSLLSDLQDSPEALIRDHLADLALAWEEIDEVRLPGGEVIPLDHSYLVALMRSDPPELDRLEGHLAEVRDTWEVWPPALHASSDLAELEDILSRPEFIWPSSEPSALQTWLEELPGKIVAFLNRLVPGRYLDVSSALNWVLFALGSLIFIAVLVYALRGIYASIAPQAVSEGEVGEVVPPASAEEALRRAELFSESEDYRSAVRYLYLSALILLEERGVMYFDSAKTNREYLRAVAHRQDLAPLFREVIQIFDRVWYGHQHIDADNYGQYAAHVARLRKAM
jgi:hypothetical protein